MNDQSKKLYAERDVIRQGEYYRRHVMAMTSERLHSKADIAAELAYRDMEIDRWKSDMHESGVALEREIRRLSAEIANLKGVPKDRYLVIGHGESDEPDMVIVNGRDEVRKAIARMIWSDPDNADGEELDAHMVSFDDGDNWSWGGFRLDISFEIGGIEIIRLNTA